MTDPSAADDAWADLYKDLGVPTTRTEPVKPTQDLLPPPLPDFDSDAEIDEENALTDAADDVEGENAGDDESDGPDADGTPGDGGDSNPDRKKRRRRRRRKKGKGSEPIGEAPVAAVVEDQPEQEVPDDEEVMVEVATDDGTSPEAARELIANWNVPSWEEIVTGLYRPERH